MGGLIAEGGEVFKVLPGRKKHLPDFLLPCIISIIEKFGHSAAEQQEVESEEDILIDDDDIVIE